MTQQPRLPPSEDFAAYLVSPYHMRRMAVGREKMLARMNNFAVGEAFPAISEALGAIAAISEFYVRLASGAAPRSTTAAIAGDPEPSRLEMSGLRRENVAKQPSANALEKASRPHLSPQERKILTILIDGKPWSRHAMLARLGSSAVPVTVNAKISVLRGKLKPTGIMIDWNNEGGYQLSAASVLLATSIFGIAPEAVE